MKDALELNIYGIKCDVCDFKDETVKVEEYEQWLNKPCPKCGANLLTEADFNNVKMLMEFTKMANAILPKRDENEEVKKISIKLNGTGEMKFEVEE